MEICKDLRELTHLTIGSKYAYVELVPQTNRFWDGSIISSLKQLTSLTVRTVTFDSSQNSLGKDAAKAIAGLRMLRKLDISGNSIRDSGLKYLTALISL